MSKAIDRNASLCIPIVLPAAVAQQKRRCTDDATDTVRNNNEHSRAQHNNYIITCSKSNNNKYLHINKIKEGEKAGAALAVSFQPAGSSFVRSM